MRPLMDLIRAKIWLRRIPGVLPLARRVRGLKRSLIDSRRVRRYVEGAAVVKIVIGAASDRDEGWCSTDIEYLDLLDRSDWERYFGERKVDRLLAEHVWEHLSPADGRRAAQMCFDYLVPGGTLRAAVPDGLHPDPEYIEYVDVGGEAGGSSPHKVLYDQKSFSELFEAVGFEVRPLEYFDSSGEFHAVDWDLEGGVIKRSKRFDHRNVGGELKMTSVIVDAVKPR